MSYDVIHGVIATHVQFLVAYRDRALQAIKTPKLSMAMFLPLIKMYLNVDKLQLFSIVESSVFTNSQLFFTLFACFRCVRTVSMAR